MLKNINFKVTGMHCNSCVTLITMELSDLEGVTGVKIALSSGLGSATLTERSVNESDVLTAVKRVGYSAKIVEAV